MRNNRRIYFFFCLIFLLLILCNSCLESILDREGVSVYLYEKMPLLDTTIVVGNSLCLDITEYFYLKDNYGRNSGYPMVEPGVGDTSIAKINYNYSWGDHGENYNILAKKVGTTELSLYLEWMTGDNTVYTYDTRTFMLSVVDSN